MMTKAHSALVVATVALSPSFSSALNLVPQQRPKPAHKMGGAFGNKRSSSTQQWMLPSFKRSQFLLSQKLHSITKDKEDLFFGAGDAADDDDKDNKEPTSEAAAVDDVDDGQKSWPIKPPATPPPEPEPEPEPESEPEPEPDPEPEPEPEPEGPNYLAELGEKLAPILNPVIVKHVPSHTIQGAAINGSFLTLLLSFLVFGPLSLTKLTTLVAAASAGIITAYISITEGAAGDFLRGIGGTTMKVTNLATGKVDQWKGESEVNKVANALLEKPKKKVPTPPKKKVAAPKKESAPVEEEVAVPSVALDYDAAARLAYEASGSKRDFGSFKITYLFETSAMVAKKWKDSWAGEEEAKKAAAEAKVAAAEAKVAEAGKKVANAAAKAKAEEEEAAAKAEEAAQAKAEEEAQAKAAAEEEAAKIKAEEESAAKAAADEAAKVKAEEEAAAKAAADEVARIKAEEQAAAKAAADEAARLEAMAQVAAEEAAAEEAAAAKAAVEEEARIEEQAAAAREAVRLMEEQEALLEDDDEDGMDDEDWEASVRLANELQGAPTLGGDIMDDIGDDMLQTEIGSLSQEEENSLGKAAREAVRKYEEEMAAKSSQKKAVRASWDDEMVAPPTMAAEAVVEEATTSAVDYTKMTVVQLKDILRSKGLKVGGKKAELIARLQESA